MPFRTLAGIDAVSGAVRSLPEANGDTLLVVDGAAASGADIPSLALVAPAGASLDDCIAGARVAGTAPTSALDPSTLAPLAAVATPNGSLLYYVDPTGAVGVAAQGANDGRFRPTGSLLWTSDRPPYGSAAIAIGTDVHVVGCRGARFLDADCFAARVPAASAGDEGAYAYYVGGGRFSPRADDAWPMTTGAASFDVAVLPSRLVMVYTGPLGSTLTVRSGLSPEGPWSSPVEVATCDLADADMFCAGVHVHPSLASAPGTIVVSYAPATLTPGVSARRAAEPAKWWPRFVALALPALP
jgi:hypothetical protein